MKNYFLIAFALGIAALFYLMGTAFAHHHELYGEDPDWQERDKDNNIIFPPRNFISSNWALTPSPNNSIRYFVHNKQTLVPAKTPTSKTYEGLVKAGISDWETEVPQLKWENVSNLSDDSSADVLFTLGPCGGRAGTFRVALWYEDKDIMKAKYTDRVTICINNENRFKTENAIKSAISHEIGHVYGLHEAYIDLPKDLTPTPIPPPYVPINDCNPDSNVASIMDGPIREAMNSQNPSDGDLYVGHCDNRTSPSERDIELVKNIYINGSFVNVSGTDNRNGTATFKWKDNVWGEANHLIVVIYSKTMNLKGEWVPSTKKIITDGVGQHRNIGGQSESEPLDFTASLEAHEIAGKELPPWTFYRGCLFAYFQPIVDYGDMECSNLIAVNNSEHNAKLTPSPTPIPSGDIEAGKTHIGVGETFKVTISNVKPEGLDVKLVPTHPLAYAPREGWTSLCGSAGIAAGSNSVTTTSLINIINFILPDTFEGCSEGKGQVRLMHGANVLASVEITVSNTPATATPTSTPGSGADSHAYAYRDVHGDAYRRTDPDAHAWDRAHSDAGNRAYADADRRTRGHAHSGPR